MKSAKSMTALLVVHGIGEQQRLDTAHKVVAGLKRVYGDELTSIDDPDAGTIDLELRGSLIHVRLYEMHWAPLFGERAKGSFIAETVQAVAFFPWLNWRHRLYQPRRRLLPVLLWTPVLVLLSLLAYLGVWGLRFLGGMAMAVRGRVPEAPRVGGLWRRAREQAMLARDMYTPVDDVMDKVVGDAFQYVTGSIPRLTPGSDADRVRAMFYERLEAARNDGCDQVQVLAHSLGTVVAFNALTGYRLPEAQTGPQDRPLKISRLWTMGSPLEKFAFFFPAMAIDDFLEAYQMEPRHAAVRGAPTKPVWVNFFNPLDPVAGRLRSFPEWQIENRRVWAGGVGRSHVVYERNARFLEALTESLFGSARAMPLRLRTRLVGVLAASVESLAVLLALTVPVLAGAALWAAVVLLLPWLGSALVGVIASDEIAQGVWEWGLLIVGIPFLAVLGFLGPMASSAETHRVWRPRNE